MDRHDPCGWHADVREYLGGGDRDDDRGDAPAGGGRPLEAPRVVPARRPVEPSRPGSEEAEIPLPHVPSRYLGPKVLRNTTGSPLKRPAPSRAMSAASALAVYVDSSSRPASVAARRSARVPGSVG